MLCPAVVAGAATAASGRLAHTHTLLRVAISISLSPCPLQTCLAWSLRQCTRCLSQVRRLPPRDVLTGLQRTATYTRNVWVRLNGGRVPGGGGAVRLPDGLPVPTSTKVCALSCRPGGCSNLL